jgi:hypothetical protein
MNNLGLFFQFGIRMQGGPAFLKRTRTPFGQLQTRLRSGSTFTGCYWAYAGTMEAVFGYNDFEFAGAYCSEIHLVYDCNSPYIPAGSYRSCSSSVYCDTARCYYTNVGYQKISYVGCNWGAFSAWTNTSSCTPTSTCGSNGNRQCQTIYSFREQDWSAYEEVDVCVVASPIAALNAVQVECVPQ